LINTLNWIRDIAVMNLFELNQRVVPAMDIDVNLCEGTWSVPNTKAIATKLKLLMDNPIPTDGAADKLYHLLGDDDLFDEINELTGAHDVRFLIALKIRDVIEMDDVGALNVALEPDARRILQRLVKNHR